MESKKKFPITNIGTVTLLMIFIVICMVVFTVLTLSKSAADYNFTKKLATQTTAYYDACSQAEELRAKADAGANKKPEVSYSVPINDRLELAVTLRLAGDHYEIVKWKEQQAGEWQGDNSINLMQLQGE